MEKIKKVILILLLVVITALIAIILAVKYRSDHSDETQEADITIEETIPVEITEKPAVKEDKILDPEVEDVKVEAKEDKIEEDSKAEITETVQPQKVEIIYLESQSSDEKLIDLDGDGDLEKIEFYFTPIDEYDDWLTSFDLSIDGIGTKTIVDPNDELHDATFEGFYDKKIAVVTIPSMKEKLILLADFGPSDDYSTDVFMFKEGKIRYLGDVEGIIDTDSLQIEDDGTFISHSRSEFLQTWFYVREYVIHRNEIVPLHRDFYPVSTFSFIPGIEYKSTTLVDYTFYAEPTNWSGLILLPAGTEVKFTRTSETGWVELEAGGSYYYVHMTNFFYIDGDDDFTADKLFSDLVFAD